MLTYEKYLRPPNARSKKLLLIIKVSANGALPLQL